MKTRTRVGTPLLIAAVALGAPPDRARLSKTQSHSQATETRTCSPSSTKVAG